MTSREFTAIATIDAARWMLSQQQEELNRLNNLSLIEKLVDKQTGHNPYIQVYKNIEIILVDMIKAKKILSEDNSKDKVMLKQVRVYIKEQQS